ncbi:uncharacterized protein PG998_003088 [Apiospora kogelbergensis]|uniref:uncharacterized protein n=1 Tax=Apiospora kogelbergensis TaxID=1337665 RepID=UPI00312F135F
MQGVYGPMPDKSSLSGPSWCRAATRPISLVRAGPPAWLGEASTSSRSSTSNSLKSAIVQSSTGCAHPTRRGTRTCGGPRGPQPQARARGSSAPAASSPSQIWEIGDIVEGHPGRLAPPPLNISRQRLQAREPADQLRHGRRGGID